MPTRPRDFGPFKRAAFGASRNTCNFGAQLCWNGQLAAASIDHYRHVKRLGTHCFGGAHLHRVAAHRGLFLEHNTHSTVRSLISLMLNIGKVPFIDSH